MKINIIVTYANNYVIGFNNNIPWNYEENNKYINDIISQKNSVIIIGYDTYLAHYETNTNIIKIVITEKSFDNTDNTKKHLYFVDSLGSSIDLCNKLGYKNIYISGGESIYSYFCKSYYYKYLDKVYITKINKIYEGNKYFYGLEEKFHYDSIKQSALHSEIEYRVLQYNTEFISPEMIYLTCLQNMLKRHSLNGFNFELKINLSKYFPLFDVIKNNKDEVLSKVLLSLKCDNININKDTKILNLIGIQPYDSIYYFNNEDYNLSCSVIHNTGNMLNDVLCNIIFSSLLTIFLAKILKIEPLIVKYTCMYNYILENDKYKLDKIIWNVPDVLPLLNIKDRNQKSIQDFELDDLDFLGLQIK